MYWLLRRTIRLSRLCVDVRCGRRAEVCETTSPMRSIRFHFFNVRIEGWARSADTRERSRPRKACHCDRYAATGLMSSTKSLRQRPLCSLDKKTVCTSFRRHRLNINRTLFALVKHRLHSMDSGNARLFLRPIHGSMPSTMSTYCSTLFSPKVLR